MSELMALYSYNISTKLNSFNIIHCIAGVVDRKLSYGQNSNKSEFHFKRIYNLVGRFERTRTPW